MQLPVGQSANKIDEMLANASSGVGVGAPVAKNQTSLVRLGVTNARKMSM